MVAFVLGKGANSKNRTPRPASIIKNDKIIAILLFMLVNIFEPGKFFRNKKTTWRSEESMRFTTI